MEWLKQFARLFGWRNRQYESLHEWNERGLKIRVWRAHPSIAEASAHEALDLEEAVYDFRTNGLAPDWLQDRLMRYPRVACVAIVDANGNGVSAYPDWH